MFEAVLMFGFGSNTAEEMKGEPRLVRVERRDLPSLPEQWYLEAVHEYQRGGRQSGYSFYRPDGSRSHRETYEYAEDGRLSRTTMYDESDAPNFRREHSISADQQTRESVAYNSSGIACERTITRMSETGQVLESVSIHLRKNERIELRIGYDSQDREVRADTRFEAHPELNIALENIDHDDGRVTGTWRRENGDVFNLSETVGTGGAESEIVMRQDGQGGIERIDARDEKGNWTEKTFLRGVSLADAEPYAHLRRSITYW